MLIINLFGAPGAGKSTGAAYIFSKLKMLGVNAELVTEFAKDKVWENNTAVLSNQTYVFGKQHFRISRCANKVDVIVTDSPEEFNDLVAKIFKSYNSINYFIERDKPYNPKGRLQTEKERDYLAEKIKDMLAKYDIQYENRRGNLSAYNKIVEDIYSQLLEYGIEVSDK